MGSFSILNNVSGLNSQNQLTINNFNLSRTLMRLSSGRRVNSGADDAAGLQIADSLRANVRALDQAVRNANDGISVAQIADGALNEIGNLLNRAVTLAEEAATDTVDSAGRVSLDNEYAQIQSEIARIATQTNFNGTAIFSTNGNNFGGTLGIFVGDTSGASSIAVTIGQITTGGSGTTLIAAERLSRRCFGIEIDPHYCDVIVRRWIAYVGIGKTPQTIVKKYQIDEFKQVPRKAQRHCSQKVTL